MVENNGKALLELGQKIIIKLAEYLDASQGGQIPVVQMKPIDNLIEELDLSELANGSLNCENVEKLLDTYLANTMHLHHPAYIGHQVSVPHIGSAFAELIHGVVNQPMSLYEMGPAAAAMEQFVVHWMLQKVGWTTGGGGVMTHGGSLANITALLTARSQMSPEAWTQGNPSNLVVLAPENAHYSISRAVSILGLGQNAMIPIPTDKSEIIIPDQIPRIFDAERQKGNQVMAIVANGCATSTGYFDPIEEVGHFCRENKVWFHVDSPHGATALLSDKYKHQVQGIELADSMIWDAHKMMRTSTLCTAILYRDQKSMLQTFTQKASYLFHEKENAGVDTMGYQIECTKAGLGSKFFWVLASLGEHGIGDYYTAVSDHAKDFYSLIAARPGFECLPPQCNIICFRFRPSKIDQLKLREKLIRTGLYYITTTEINGDRYLRLVVMNQETDRNVISGMLDQIEILADQISQ